MATRALLLCGDEKAVHAVTQILDELEICFEHSSEPSFALKRLAARRFELLIVDCDNVQNATQVFNSARASNLNKASIAIAIVEGKAGVPSAFRLGASLVLTKPVSLDQARNTLRTGVGMTRKEAQEAKASAPVVSAIPSIPAVFTTAPVAPAPVASAQVPLGPTAPPVVPVPAVSTPVATAPAAAPPAAKAPVTPAPSTTLPTAAPAPMPVIPKSPDVATKAADAEMPASEKKALPPAAASEKPALTSRANSSAPPSIEKYKPALTNFTEEPVAPAKAAPVLAKAAAAASAVTVGTSKFDSVFSEAATTADEAKSKTSAGKTDAAETGGKTGEKSTVTLRIEDPLADEDSALDPIRDNGVPSFGTTQSFAGLHTEKRKGRGLLVAFVLLVLITGAGVAAWMTHPGFREAVLYEYGEVNTKVAEFRGQAPAKTIAAPQALPTPAVPAPAQADLQAQQAPAAAATDANGMSTSAASTTPDAAENLTTISPSATPGSSANPAQSTNATAPANPQKGASIQTAKQNTTAGHGGTNPAVVPANVNLPPSNGVGKSHGSDLVEVPEDFADDQVIHRVHPAYPHQARAKKLHGTVVLQAVVNKQGKVDSLQLVSGDPQLAQAAAEAVKQWRYKPYSRNGEPTDFQTRVTVDFKLP